MSRSILIASRKGLFRFKKSGGKWSVSDEWFVGDNLPMCLGDPRDGAIYAALEHGHFGSKIQKSTDDGATWTEIGVPVYPKQPEGEEEVNPFSGKKLEWKLEKIWSLEPGGPDEPGVLWCGTLPGGLFQSRDGGATWSIVEGLWYHPKRRFWFGGGADFAGIHSVCVDPRDSRHVIVGVSCAGAWRTRDGGATWENCAQGMEADYMPPDQKENPDVQDPHRIVACRSNPDVLWTQHHNGIFKSVNNSESWSRIENVKPSAFGFAVVVHPDDPNRAWFVPGIKDEKRIPVDGRFVVTRTRDGGKTFETLTKGLPEGKAYDIVYRHAMDISDDGGVIALGSTTGSLWISEDQGDSWSLVGTHLPPIYCVRFAA